MPGGFGTLDEFFELITLVQTGRIPQFPLILFGRAHWRGLLRWMKGSLLREKMISPGDLDLFFLTDDVEAAVQRILNYMKDVGPPEVTPPTLA